MNQPHTAAEVPPAVNGKTYVVDTLAKRPEMDKAKLKQEIHENSRL